MKSIKFYHFNIYFGVDFKIWGIDLAYVPKEITFKNGTYGKCFIFIVIRFKPRFGLNLFNHSIINPYRS